MVMVVLGAHQIVVSPLVLGGVIVSRIVNHHAPGAVTVSRNVEVGVGVVTVNQSEEVVIGVVTVNQSEEAVVGVVIVNQNVEVVVGVVNVNQSAEVVVIGVVTVNQSAEVVGVVTVTVNLNVVEVVVGAVIVNLNGRGSPLVVAGHVIVSQMVIVVVGGVTVNHRATASLTVVVSVVIGNQNVNAEVGVVIVTNRSVIVTNRSVIVVKNVSRQVVLPGAVIVMVIVLPHVTRAGAGHVTKPEAVIVALGAETAAIVEEDVMIVAATQVVHAASAMIVGQTTGGKVIAVPHLDVLMVIKEDQADGETVEMIGRQGHGDVAVGNLRLVVDQKVGILDPV